MSYVHTCPCGGDLRLIACTVSCWVPIGPDGFYLGDSACDTSDEVVYCDKCGKSGPLEMTDDEEEAEPLPPTRQLTATERAVLRGMLP